MLERLTTSALLPVIQMAITPVILISGMGALMITLTGRMARIVDRTRHLANQVREARGDERQHLWTQLDIMWKRARLIRLAVTLNGFSMLVSCFLIVAIFLDAIIVAGLARTMLALFAASIFLIVASLICFLRDIHVSLRALQLEVHRAWTVKDDGSSVTQAPFMDKRDRL
jgi:hypothetical protein